MTARFDLIKTTIKYAGKPVEVNYDCNEITYYVDDSTELMDFAYTHAVLHKNLQTIHTSLCIVWRFFYGLRRSV